MMAFTVNLIGPSPWGFRISGGRDFKKAITVSKVNPGSKAELACLQPGDIILEINGENTGDMLNVEAQNKIKNCKTQLQLQVDRPALPSPGQTNGINTTEQLVGRFQEAVQVSRDENQNYREYSISSPASLSPGPYSPEPPSSPDRKGERITPTSNKSLQLRSWSPEEKNTSYRLSRPLSQEFSSMDFRSNSVSSRTPTPPGRYSPHSPIERELSVSPRRSSDFAMQRFDRDSEVYKMIQENKESRTAPRQSNTFKMLQEVLEADEKEAALRFPGKLSPSPPKPVVSSSVAGVQKYHTCEKCGTNIVTQAVKIIDDRYRHPECYTCTDCGLNLKMRGHFWVGNEMFCEKHARERYQGPGAGYRHPISPHH
ncbi:PDZ and LIM domain protein 2 [Astyanax mexicanus]|uniref:PDZ and LIM domain protein 2 n=2 Tax=Astyanax mexicanus TaxID=7994 RepID=A0A8B9KWS9_ASTMX|nr:PDZ and LIM domain protein 2 [Astyanax mexicanus]KAG9270402.1 PDZ and LIM domain protein 2 [Astyanax mexicanus]